jgi:hypothetical protein
MVKGIYRKVTRPHAHSLQRHRVMVVIHLLVTRIPYLNALSPTFPITLLSTNRSLLFQSFVY